MVAKLTDRVRLADGTVEKLSALIERGEVTFSKSERFRGDRGASRVAYFADHVSGYCVEIGKRDYERMQA